MGILSSTSRQALLSSGHSQVSQLNICTSCLIGSWLSQQIPGDSCRRGKPRAGTQPPECCHCCREASPSLSNQPARHSFALPPLGAARAWGSSPLPSLKALAVPASHVLGWSGGGGALGQGLVKLGPPRHDVYTNHGERPLTPMCPLLTNSTSQVPCHLPSNHSPELLPTVIFLLGRGCLVEAPSSRLRAPRR